MKIKRKIIKFGPGSKVVILPKEIAKKVIEGHTYAFEMELISEDAMEEIASYQCMACNHIFDTDLQDFEIYCPACGNEAYWTFKKTGESF